MKHNFLHTKPKFQQTSSKSFKSLCSIMILQYDPKHAFVNEANKNVVILPGGVTSNVSNLAFGKVSFIKKPNEDGM